MELLGGAALVLSFELLYQRRVSAVIGACALQAWVSAAASAWQGFAQDAPQLFVLALVTAAASGIAVPLVLHRIARRIAVRHREDAAPGIVPGLVLGAGLAGLSVLVVPRDVPMLALALSVVMLGLLTMLARRDAPARAAGLLSLSNGLVLAATTVPATPQIAALPVAFLALVALIAGGARSIGVRALSEASG